MVRNHSTHSWIGSFAARLIQLRPRTSIGAAVQSAVGSYHHASDLEPARAAEIFAEANAMVEAIGRQSAARARAVASSSSRYRTRFG